MAQKKGALWCIAILTCIATVTSISWLTALISAQHQEGIMTLDHNRHSLLEQDSLSDTSTSALRIRATAQRQQKYDYSQGGVEKGRSEQLTKAASQNSESIADTQSQKAGSQSQETKYKVLNNTDFAGGEAVAWGPYNKKKNAEACCAACRNFKPKAGKSPCKFWVFCGDKEKCKEQYRDCWLKSAVHMAGIKPDRGPHVMYTSGVMPEYDEDASALAAQDVGGVDRTFHVAVTAQGFPTHWQIRIAYYWYKKTQRECLKEKVCHMGGYTRILHGGEDDELMKEVPTVVVRPLEDKDNQGYVVLNRPWAFVQWLRTADIPEKYVLMSEPDHLWMKPMPNLMKGEKPAAFPFFYIEPTNAEYSPFVQRFTGPLSQTELEKIPPVGNAPTMMSFQDLKGMAEIWMNTTHAIFDDDEVHKAWNWVLEMWGFAISTYKAGLIPVGVHWNIMCQPPYDVEPPEGPEHYLMHYTYGMDYHLDGSPMFGQIGEWRFDKRTFAQEPIPRNMQNPPEGMTNHYVRRLINMFNEATEMIPGWDEYAEFGIAKQFWDGKTFKD